MPYAVDNAYFQSRSASAAPHREEFRRELNLESGRPIILYASKLMERKRCIDLIDAYLGMRVGEDGQRPYLLIVGDGTERAACEAKVNAAGERSVRSWASRIKLDWPGFMISAISLSFPRCMSHSRWL